jgi:hypothetical protein
MAKVALCLIGSLKAPSGANLTFDTEPEPPRLLRFARNDTAKGCHCEERSDEAIST